MKYYEGIDFAMADVQLGSRNRKRNYPFYYGIQLVYAGEIALSIDRGKEIRRKGPTVFLTTPEHYYEYSSPGWRPGIITGSAFTVRKWSAIGRGNFSG